MMISVLVRAVVAASVSISARHGRRHGTRTPRAAPKWCWTTAVWCSATSNSDSVVRPIRGLIVMRLERW